VMLGAGALEIKRLKKKLFLFYSKLRGTYSNITWHASTEIEKKEIQNVFGEKAKVITTLNLSQKKKFNFQENPKLIFYM